MHKIDGAGHDNGRFVHENYETGRPPTEVTADWLNALQDEVSGVVQAAGLGLDKKDNQQLLKALMSSSFFQTPAQFDASRKVATTEFVQRALGNYNFSPFKVNQTLTAAQSGMLMDWYGTANGTITMPLISSLSAGAAFKFQNISAFSLTIFPQGADVIFNGNTAVSSIVLGPGDCLEVAHDSARWISIGGSAALKGASVFSASIGASGYQKLPSGLIIQWAAPLYPTSGLITWTFPIAFPSAALAVWGGLAPSSAADFTGRTIGPYFWSSTSAQFAVAASGAPAANVVGCQVFAIGK